MRIHAAMAQKERGTDQRALQGVPAAARGGAGAGRQGCPGPPAALTPVLRPMCAVKGLNAAQPDAVRAEGNTLYRAIARALTERGVHSIIARLLGHIGLVTCSKLADFTTVHFTADAPGIRRLSNGVLRSYGQAARLVAKRSAVASCGRAFRAVLRSAIMRSHVRLFDDTAHGCRDCNVRRNGQ